MKTMEYYFDYSKEAYDYIMSSKILRNRDKKILEDIVKGKKTKEIAVDHKCSYRTVCTRRKEIFEKTKCLLNYDKSMGDIEKYYNENISKIKTYGNNQFKAIDNNTELFKVYLLTFPNNKIYIGITCKKEKDRWRRGEGYVSNQVMYNDILKYGWINIKKNILYNDLLYDEAREKEKELIINYKSHLKKYGYNRNF